MNKLILLYITNESKDEAKRIARHLLEKRLVGCANIFPVNALYWWEGKMTDEEEVVLIVKTVEDNFDKVKEEVEKIHSFSTPCILKIPVEANEKYFEWLKGEIRVKSLLKSLDLAGSLKVKNP